MPDELANRILTALAAAPGLKAKEIASKLGVERKKVSSLLHGPLTARVLQDNTYRWYLVNDAPQAAGNGEEEEVPDTPLARLCRYYLECLAHDDRDGVSVFAHSKFELDYCELPAWPFGPDAHAPFAESDVQALVARASKTKLKDLYLGFPVFIRKAGKTQAFTFVEPVFLFRCATGAGRPHGAPAIGGDVPWINQGALKSLPKSVGESPQQEAIRLTELLGLDKGAVNPAEFDEVVDRLRAERADWRWVEDPDPYTLRRSPRLSRVSRPGLYNRAVLVLTEKPKYTLGLESELNKLMRLKEEEYADTALGGWLAARGFSSPPPPAGDPLLEALPLNTEQRAATRQGLANDLTVVTGPPGTGKSQVVTSLLVNAAWSGTKVLFASRNNKAVDVVEERVNDLGPRPVLLRLGNPDHHLKLAEYVTRLLSAKTSAEDIADYKVAESRLKELRSRFQDLEAQLGDVVKLRNQTDRLDRAAEPARETFGEERLGLLADDRKLGNFSAGANRLAAAVKRAEKGSQAVLVKALWPLLGGRRAQNVVRTAAETRETLADLGVDFPEAPPSNENMEAWRGAAKKARERACHLRAYKGYLASLRDLDAAIPLDAIEGEQHALIKDLVPASEQVWKAWLATLPGSLSDKDRQVLGNMLALIKLKGQIDAEAQGLLPDAAKVLPCWALTNLTARRFPFAAGCFDIVVVDEASQCDIASALPLLFRAKRAVIIGDPQQLRHITQLGRQQDEKLLDKHGLLAEHVRWSYSVTSLYDLASALCRAGDVVTLRDHHRSHAHIIGFSNEHFYGGSLRVATSYDRLRLIDDGPVVRWRHVDGSVRKHGGKSALNEAEAQGVVDELETLILKQGYRGDVGVVTPFRAQANRIKQLANHNAHLSEILNARKFLAETAHSLQGDERDLIVFSPVAAPGLSDASLWFLKGNGYLFNVAITRARGALRVIGHRDYAAKSEVDYLAAFSDYVRRIEEARDGTGSSGHHRPLASLGPEYPAVENPEWVSEWERVFYRALYRAGIRVIPQYAVEKYRLDFALFDGDRRLNIEVDGERYHSDWDGELLKRDQLRNARMIELGWDVMRFWVYQIRDSMDGCVARVRQWLDLSAPPA